MNNGNLLNSLLGITNANPAVSKAAAAKARAESTEKFQQALEQVRPEVAARKPVARKENPPAEPVAARPAPKPAAQHNSPQETHKADAPPKARNDTQDSASKAVEKSEAAVPDRGVDEPVMDELNKEQSADSQQQTLAGETQKGEVESQSADDITIALDSLLLVAPVVSNEGKVEEVVASPESLLNTATPRPLVSGESVNEGDIGLPLDNSVLDPDVLAIQQPSLVPVAPVASEVSIMPELAAGALFDSQSPLVLTTQIAPGHLASLTITDAPSAQPAALQTVGGALPGNLSGELALDDAETETDVLAGDGTVTDSGENPDFLLLNSKAALNKLAETSMTAATLDKTAPAADLAKPAPVSAAIETLTRLAETQSPATRAFVVQTGVPVAVGTPQWSQAVGDKVLWLAAQNVSSAEIRLDPPELGPMQVKVSVNQDQATVTFTSPHPAVREALDQQLNRLREMFSEQGLNLVNVDVSDKSFAQQKREQEESAKNSGSHGLDEDELAPLAITQAISMRLVDHYA
ncbi:flagellar hook-length control protein FliK [Cellvibrio sp.]